MTSGGWERARAWIELARLSNAPTVVSNAFCGIVFGAVTAGKSIPWLTFVNVSLGCVLIYGAGMILNDAIDAPTDALERPKRPIPSGRVARGYAFAGAIAALIAGVGMFATSGPDAILMALVLAVCVVLYDLAHARTAASVLLLGACRALVYLAAFASMARTEPWSNRPIVTLAAIIFVYTALFSLLARREVGPLPEWARGFAWLFPIAAAFAMVLLTGRSESGLLLYILGGVLMLFLSRAAMLWLATPSRGVHAVMAWIAAFCLIDAMAVSFVADWRLASVPIACFLMTIGLQRRILGS